MIWQNFIELISNFVQITGDPTVDTILFLVIGFFSFSVAFGFVGKIFDFLGYYDSDLMSQVHWILRVLIFVALTFILIWLFKFVDWLLSFQWWVYLIIAILIIGVVVLIHVLRHKYQKKKYSLEPLNSLDNLKNEESVKTSEILITQNEQRNKKDYCPRCGAPLTERIGPYGRFIGCSAFPKCTYTRSIK